MAASHEGGIRSLKPRACVLRTDGTNCDQETAFALELSGARADYLHVNELRSGRKRLLDYQIMVIPGGFSYGDDVLSGKILAVELTSLLREQLQEFVDKGRLLLGICNGFQVLVRTGLLPYSRIGSITTTLMPNDSGRFECRWVSLKVEKSPCVFTESLAGRTVTYQVAHGEGKFFTSQDVLDDLERRGLVVFRYVDAEGRPTQAYPANPNGSLHAVAGICDPSGRIMGLMPHPERFVLPTQHPNWRRGPAAAEGLPIFQDAVNHARQM